VNIGLNVAAIPSLGINGAAEATLACEVITMAFMMHLVITQVKIHPRVFQALARPLAAGLLTCGLLAPIYLHHGLSEGVGLVLIPSVCVVYFGLLVLFRGVPHEVRTALRAARRTTR
jgi:O-antigen/teichoic acid export membrane protein